MTNIRQLLAGNDLVSGGDANRTGLRMGIDSEPLAAFDDDEVTRQGSQIE